MLINFLVLINFHLSNDSKMNVVILFCLLLCFVFCLLLCFNNWKLNWQCKQSDIYAKFSVISHLEVPKAVHPKNSSRTSKGKRNRYWSVRVWHHSGSALLASTTGSWTCWISLFTSFLVWYSSPGTSKVRSGGEGSSEATEMRESNSSESWYVREREVPLY